MQVPMEILHSFYFTLLLALASSSIFMAQADDPLSHALLSLKSELTYDSNSLQDWNLPSKPEPSSQIIHACSWTGVKCNENGSTIIGLDLSAKGLKGSLSGKQFSFFVDLVDLNISHNSFSGQLPAGIFDLKSLKSLDISRNNFSGHFPGGISRLGNLVVLDAFSNSFSGPLPGDVAQVETLKVLNFAGSYFSGPIPSEYGSFKSLEFVHLAGNFLSGNLPPELGKLKTLSHVEIGYNSYEGGIPWEFGNMSELVYLDIADANLSGPIPMQLSNLSKLESLFLFRNQLNGKIPGEFSQILSLKSLDLSDNMLSGPIPDSFSELKNLRLLSLMYNDLSGPVPEGIAKLPELDTLLIWNNYFTGQLPQDLGRYSKLQHLDVSTNYFVGSIPPDICAGGNLLKLILFSNNFTGGLFPSLSNCSSLVRVRLEDNSFSGEISLKFSSMRDLSYVDLSRNRFVGGLSDDIDQAYGLQYFNVSYNPELGGIIPAKTWALPNLQNFSVVNSGLSGNVPSFESCKSLSVLELSTNNLSGSIPEDVSNCKDLSRLDLARNNLTGPIPIGLSALPSVSFLDLSHNRLDGPIPMSLGNSSSLKFFNVSYNDISGLIPQDKAFKEMDKSAFLGNPKLCGEPLRPCHGDENGIPSGLELGSWRTQKLAWILISFGAIVLLVTVVAFGILYLKRYNKGCWKMVAFSGLAQFTAKDVLRSLNSSELGGSACKAVLPTGITVSVKKIEWNPKTMKSFLQCLSMIGNIRHKNLTRLLGVCYNNHVGYLLYDYLPNGSLAERIGIKNDWTTKYKIVIGIARGLCFLHHDCNPAVVHGNLKARNVLFDENMEPHLADYGLKSFICLANSQLADKNGRETVEFSTSIAEELYMDVYQFGELILELLTNGGSANAVTSIHNTSKENLILEITNKTKVVSSNSFEKEVKLVLEVALLCTKSRPSDRPSMEQVLKQLLGSEVQKNCESKAHK